MLPEDLNALAKQALDAAFRIHSTLGPGLLESACTAGLISELRKQGLEVRTEVPVPLVYEGVKLVDIGYKMYRVKGTQEHQ